MEQIRIKDIKRKKTLLDYISRKKVKVKTEQYIAHGQTELVILLKKGKKYKVIKGGQAIEIAYACGKDFVWCKVFKNISIKKVQKVLQ